MIIIFLAIISIYNMRMITGGINVLDMKSEKCACCNGTGKESMFDEQQKKWVESDIDCKYCQGNKVRSYYIVNNGTGFMKKKVYAVNVH